MHLDDLPQTLRKFLQLRLKTWQLQLPRPSPAFAWRTRQVPDFDPCDSNPVEPLQNTAGCRVWVHGHGEPRGTFRAFRAFPEAWQGKANSKPQVDEHEVIHPIHERSPSQSAQTPHPVPGSTLTGWRAVQDTSPTRQLDINFPSFVPAYQRPSNRLFLDANSDVRSPKWHIRSRFPKAQSVRTNSPVPPNAGIEQLQCDHFQWPSVLLVPLGRSHYLDATSSGLVYGEAMMSLPSIRPQLGNLKLLDDQGLKGGIRIWKWKGWHECQNLKLSSILTAKPFSPLIFSTAGLFVFKVHHLSQVKDQEGSSIFDIYKSSSSTQLFAHGTVIIDFSPNQDSIVTSFARGSHTSITPLPLVLHVATSSPCPSGRTTSKSSYCRRRLVCIITVYCDRRTCVSLSPCHS